MKSLKSLFAAACLAVAMNQSSFAVVDESAPVPVKDGQTDWSVCEEPPLNLPFEGVVKYLQDVTTIERRDSNGKEGVLSIEGRNIGQQGTPEKPDWRWMIAKVVSGKTLETAQIYYILYDRNDTTHCIIPETVYNGILSRLPAAPVTDLTPQMPMPR